VFCAGDVIFHKAQNIFFAKFLCISSWHICTSASQTL